MGVVRSLLCSLCGGVLGVLVASMAPFAPSTAPFAPERMLVPEAPVPRNPAPRGAPAPQGAAPKAAASSSAPTTMAMLAAPPPLQAPAEATDRPDPNTPEAACIETPSCVDGYLWSVYRRKPTTFAWKDAKAAAMVGLSPSEFVVGGMDPEFRTTLYRALRTLDLFGFMPGITCGFRDDYRQSITTGKKAQFDRSFHGGSAHGGYGHGQAADIVSTRDVTDRMYAFIDRHEQVLGIGRPYRSGDPPHVAPLDGEEYLIHRLVTARVRGQLPLVVRPLHDPPDTALRARAFGRRPAAFGSIRESGPAP